ncbi:hypothetical protein HMPREF0198_2374 [Cardiobacterium hominis ATCC 15826]|uniref:Uncharacterized protein n=1 Tax=Cardiobacterium hominis (strain ATCC 15826 / DSM 8339 / NCTC 10426 / 6573) TaxID=638300 RepID=C8NCZ6_CARH6|nr:hypothetical protein HMPREF0198_2374 [Cardiobacterium hominis ATCC 15826]
MKIHYTLKKPKLNITGCKAFQGVGADYNTRRSRSGGFLYS